MKLSTCEDIEAPIEEVFAVISDFDMIERALLGGGAEVVRTDRLGAPGPGMAWTVAFDFHGKRREVATAVTDFSPPEAICLESSASGLCGVSVIELAALAPDRTRLAVAVDLRPQTISARVLLQTIRLAKEKVSSRFESGIARLAREIEAGRFRDGGPWR